MEPATEFLKNRTRVLALGLSLLLTCGLGSTMTSLEDEGVEVRVAELLYSWEDEELPAELLALDPGLKRRRTVSAEATALDVERLFYLFSHGYSGYAYLAGPSVFQEGKERILRRIRTRSTWKVDDLPKLIREELPFIRDCHTSIGGLPFGDHRDFWFDTSIEFQEIRGEYRFEYGGNSCTLIAINGLEPEAMLVPSLDREGEVVHRIGLTTTTAPGPAIVTAAAGEHRLEIEVPLERSEFSHFATEIFQEDSLGGIPVLRVRSFSDHYQESLEAWVQTADALKNEPCVVLDVRGNRGGSELYPIEWIRRLTGVRVGSGLIFSELKSRTTMAGRLNAFRRWQKISPDISFFREQEAQHLELFESLGTGGTAPYWSGPFYPSEQTVPNRTTVVVVTNGLVGSAGEGLVMRASRLENVVVVGENTRGALTFGNVSLHQLPNSGLDVWLPINLNLFPDLEFREESGLEPDYWVPAGDAVNYAIAALRRGTIPTARALPQALFQRELVFEDPDYRRKLTLRRQVPAGGVGALAGLLFVFLLRRKPRNLVTGGVSLVFIGVIWQFLGRSKGDLLIIAGSGFLAFGIVWLCAGLLLWLPGARRSSQTRA